MIARFLLRCQPSPLKAGSAPALTISRPAQRSRTLRPACSQGRPRRPLAPKASAVSLPPLPLRLLPAGATQLPGGTYTRKLSAPLHGALRGASHVGSLTIGSGSSNPIVDMRRREESLPASLVSTLLPRFFALLGSPSPPQLCAHESGHPYSNNASFRPRLAPVAAKTLQLGVSKSRHRVDAPNDARPATQKKVSGTVCQGKRTLGQHDTEATSE